MNTGSCFSVLSDDNTSGRRNSERDDTTTEQVNGGASRSGEQSRDGGRPESWTRTLAEVGTDTRLAATDTDNGAEIDSALTGSLDRGAGSRGQTCNIHHGGASSRLTGALNSNSNGQRPLILITDSNQTHRDEFSERDSEERRRRSGYESNGNQGEVYDRPRRSASDMQRRGSEEMGEEKDEREKKEEEEEKFEEVDGIRYRIVSAVTKPATNRSSKRAEESHRIRHQSSIRRRPEEAIIEQQENEESSLHQTDEEDNRWAKRDQYHRGASLRMNAANSSLLNSKLSSVRRKSTAFVSNLLHSTFVSESDQDGDRNVKVKPPRRLSIYEMTKSPPPETSLEIYLNERRRSSNVSAQQVQQQLEQQSTFETNYNQRQQYFRDLNQKLINQDRKLLNVVANRGHIHRHSVDIAQLPLTLATAKNWKPREPSDEQNSDDLPTSPGADPLTQRQPIDHTDHGEESDKTASLRTSLRYASISEDKSMYQGKLNSNHLDLF